jgi:zinc and cadmium transporter
MDTLVLWIVAFTLLGGVLSVLIASVLLVLPERMLLRLLSPLVSFATGALLGAAFLALLPHAIEGAGSGNVHAIGITILAGLLAFFLLEKLVLWRHCHADACEAHGIDEKRLHDKAAGNLILVGDGIHNMVDGVLIAAAFLTDVHLGVVTSLAVVAHEIPQEIGDFAILLHSGFSRGRALLYNVLSSLTTVVGGVAAYYSLSLTQQAIPYIVAIAASSFIYIAVADLIPGLHKRLEPKTTLQQIVLIALGIAVIFVAHSTLH